MSLPSWVQPIETKPAPMPLLRVQAFVNTWEDDTGVDDLGDWLGRGGLGTDPATAADVAMAVRVREGIRAMLVANAGGGDPAATDLAPLRQVAADHPPALSVDDDGRVSVDVGGTAVGAALGRLLVVIRDAQVDGSWARLKACANCRWAFFDRSHSRRGRWCDMAVCGNRVKNRNYRRR